MAQTFDCYIFDLDGTLLDTLPDLVVLTNTVLKEFGFPERTTQQIVSYVGNGARALMYQAVPQDASEAVVEASLERWKALYSTLGHAQTRPYEGMTSTLLTLKNQGIKLGVLSNKFDEATRSVIDRNFPGIFDAVHGESPQFPRKPNPQGLLTTIRELGSTPQTTVYVGDSPGDIVTAHAAGTFALAVSWGYRSVEDLKEAGYDALIYEPTQLLNILEH